MKQSLFEGLTITTTEFVREGKEETGSEGKNQENN
jgi:hypothetical protein